MQIVGGALRVESTALLQDACILGWRSSTSESSVHRYKDLLNCFVIASTWVDPEGGHGVQNPLENYKLPFVSL